MFEDEELIIFRRILSIFALGCKLSAALRKAFFDTPLSDTLLKTLGELSKTTDEYQYRTSGIIQATAVLILNLVEGGHGDNVKIPPFIKALTFARLDSFALHVMFNILRSMDVEQLRNRICIGCNKDFKFNETYNTAEFTTNSCLLQILATSVECIFPVAAAGDYWTVPRYQKLLALTKCLIKFFRKSIVDMNSDWLQADRSCRCYVKLTTSFIILSHLCLHLYHTIPTLRTETRRTQTVSQLILLLIYDIFTANMQMKLLNIMGRPIKNRLIVVYNLLMHYNGLFKFRLAQGKQLFVFFSHPPLTAFYLSAYFDRVK